MINKNIVIAALARDCKSALINNIPKIEKLRSYFKESHVVVVENDSIDGTKEVLYNWDETSYNVNIISQDFGVKTIGTQTASDHNTAPIRIGNNVWIAAKNLLLKGTIIGNNCVVGASSVLNKNYNQDNVIIAGSPAKCVKEISGWRL